MEQSFMKVMRGIGEALKLDDEQNHQAAYIQYVECILSIASNLLQNVRSNGDKVLVTAYVEKQIMLGKQCMDRISTLFHEFNNEAEIKNGNELEKSGGISRFAAPVPPLHIQPSSSSFSLKRNLSPTEIAYRQNQSLMRAYKARLATMSKNNPMAANLSLTVQRKLAENLAIANAQERAVSFVYENISWYCKLSEKMKETQRRLDEQAARRFMSPIGMSEEEQEQRQIYKKILEYEQQAKWLLEWRIKLSNSPKDQVVISQLVTQILRCEDHPLTKLLMKYQYKIYEKLYPLVSTKMATVNEICVPLPESFHPKRRPVLEESCDSKKKNNGNDKEDCDKDNDKEDSDKDNDKQDSDKLDQDKDNGKQSSVNDKQGSECLRDKNDESCIVSDIVNITVNDSKNREYSEQFVNIECKNNVENFTEQTITDLKTAVDQNAKLTEQLSMDNKKIYTSVRSMSREFESYSEENMDDLFDDDNNDVESLAGNKELDKIEFNLQRQDSEAYVVLSSNDVDSSSKFRDNLYKFRRPSEIARVRTMSEEAYVRHLKGVSQDIHHALEKLLVMFSIGYEELGSAEGQDQCYASIEEPFFKPIWKYLLNIFRLSNKTEETALAYCMTIKQGDLPESYGVSRKLCLVSDVEGTLPFQSAINEIRRLKDHYTMLSKLECVVNVCRLICECVENFYTTKQIQDGEISSTPCVGADDLLPILTYVVVKSGLPQLLSECQAMAEFIHEGYIMGEEGYCLTSVQTAISFLSSQEIQNK
ncbi:hypothetical protein LOTGIDRAFT_233615 [Lottia gigantea]|uniref:VPS9 domain-containing protein n=1 Tax=Lottia gigantea TaxID=225164 RepID=V4A7A0_LOTGI|nr:hypothetical protein LOTGIDRAFT_233615 [Lottia gigantea]ESO90860.1 hypothetical protein LOTGIDRAFT_233615 [Lottia gigantea]